jgi:hypothetical protein
LGLTLVVVTGGAVAAPHFPPITDHRFQFDAINPDGTLAYATNGTSPDTLTYVRRMADHESISYRPDGEGGDIYPIWDEVVGPPLFGGDFYMALQFNSQDAPIGDLDVSLVGTGANTEPGAADLEIYGTLELDDDPNNALKGLLWAVDLESVSLYGNSENPSYSVDGVGTVVGGLVAELNGLVGGFGAVRGEMDFRSAPEDWMPAFYDPTDDVDLELQADYSGDSGVPEPTTLVMLLVGAGLWRRR